MKNIGNYRKYNIFLNFRFTASMIFPSIAENQENMIFTLSVFTRMLFFMQCVNTNTKQIPMNFKIYCNRELKNHLLMMAITF